MIQNDNMPSVISRINVKWFVVSFAVGLMLCYVMTPPPQVILKFPSPQNAGHVLYHDKDDTCYKYRADRVSCPVDRSLVMPQPILEQFR